LCDPNERPAREDDINSLPGGPEEEVMNNRRSMWITKAAAVAALVGGLGGVARATILVAGGFPGENFNTGFAECAVTNTGTRDVVVSQSMFDGPGGSVLEQATGWIVHPGQTRVSQSVSFASANPSACTFDVSTKTGVRAAFVYSSGFNGSTVVVIPAQK
jgi:hypothetical protein